jgi:hypothetical protein
MAAILDSLGFTFLIDRMTEVLTPDIYIELTGCGPEAAIFVARKWRQLLRKVTEKRKQKRALHCG